MPGQGSATELHPLSLLTVILGQDLMLLTLNSLCSPGGFKLLILLPQLPGVAGFLRLQHQAQLYFDFFF